MVLESREFPFSFFLFLFFISFSSSFFLLFFLLSFYFSCVVETGAAMNGLLLGPIACLIFPAALLNFHVLVKIALVARKRNASLQAILRLQLRSFGFVTTLLAIFLFYWVWSFPLPPLSICFASPFVLLWFCFAQTPDFHRG
jgi:hypothetical protein